MRFLAVDPGITVGWSVWEDDELIDGGQDDLWYFADNVFVAVIRPEEAGLPGFEIAEKIIGIETMVVEDFRIYPWEAKKGTLNWDPVRTARLIGALNLTARHGNLDFILQGAKIKERAEAAGAEAYFWSPLHDLRHFNDSCRHAVYFNAVKRGIKPVKSN